VAGNAQALIGSYGSSVASITASSTDNDWTRTGSALPIVCVARTLTVPAGNVGDVKLNADNGGGTGTPAYSKNGGAFIDFTLGTIVNFADNDTLNFELRLGASGSQINGPIIDNTTGATIGNVNINRL
jgi:hypothetical protein